MKRFIIVGTGRCGTTYATAILRICGINTSHQKYFTFKERHLKAFENVDGEASFMAVPYLKEIKKQYPDIVIIHLYRDKQKVINSWQRTGVFRLNYEKFYPILSKHFKQNASEWYDKWFDEAEKYADYSIDLDVMTREPYMLFKAIDAIELYDEAMVKLISKRTNRHD